MTTTAATGPIPELDDAWAVLTYARDQRREAQAAESRLLQAAVVWADQHPAASIVEAACLPGADVAIPIAGPGAPLISEFCIAEFASAVAMTTEAGRAYLGQAVELAYRLPKLYARVIAGQVPAWRARRIADMTMTLTLEAVTFVDAQLAPFAHKVGVVTADRLVQEAIGRFMPGLARQQAAERAEHRRFDIDHPQVSFEGTCALSGELDLADALDLEAPIATGAEALKAAGSTETLPVRRARAAGELARAQLGLVLNDTPNHAADAANSSGGTGDTGTEPHRRSTPAPTKPRQVVIYAHLSADALTGGTCEGLQVARVENRRTLITVEQVRAWCGNPDTQVVIRPVIDLAEHVHVGAYEVPDRLAEQAQLRDLTCVFPWCERPARGCDTDHVLEHQRHGPTCSCNTAPLCRRHHRLKTHTAWTYTVLEPGAYLWSSPHGHQYLRDHTGTLDVTPRDRTNIRERRFAHLNPEPGTEGELGDTTDPGPPE